MTHSGSEVGVREDPDRMIIMDSRSCGIDMNLVVTALRQDRVVLLRNVEADGADNVMRALADRLGLGASLELQAGFAGFLGHRHNIGKYFMSVSDRSDYQFVPPHSE